MINLLEKATRFDLGYFPIAMGKYIPDIEEYGHNFKYIISLELRNRDPKKWAIILEMGCLSKSGEILDEFMPSHRNKDFIDQTRFDSIEEAVEFFEKWHKQLIEWCEKNKDKVLNYWPDFKFTP
jgi:hypothetical protein